MFILNEDMSIRITRGDSAALEVTFSGDAPSENDSVVSTLKEAPGARRAIWKKDWDCIGDGTWLLTIDPEDTDRLSFGTYAWDVRIFYADGNVTTPFDPQEFVVSPVVTDNE